MGSKEVGLQVVEMYGESYLLGGWSSKGCDCGFRYWLNGSGRYLACGYVRREGVLMWVVFYPDGEVLAAACSEENYVGRRKMLREVEGHLNQLCENIKPLELESGFASWLGVGKSISPNRWLV